jgi:hypothetical protein
LIVRRRIAPPVLTVTALLLLGACLVPGTTAEWIYLLLVPLFPVLLVLLASERRGSSSRRLDGLLLVLAVLLTVSTLAIRLLDSRPDPPWIWGLPLSALVMLGGLVLLPLLLVGLGFAGTFDPPPASAAGVRRGGGRSTAGES